jgi:hypothetical protein
VKNVRRRCRPSSVRGEVGIPRADTRAAEVVVPECSFDWYQPAEVAQLLAAARDERARTVLLFALHRGFRMGVAGGALVGYRLRQACPHHPPLAAEVAGLRRIKWHELRHSFASILTSGGAPLRVVQSLLGHSSIRMTERYPHLAPGQSSGFTHRLSTTDASKNWGQRRGQSDPEAPVS